MREKVKNWLKLSPRTHSSRLLVETGMNRIALLVNSRTKLNSGQLLDDRLQLLALDQLEATLGCHSRRFHVCLIQLLFHNLQKGELRMLCGTCAFIEDDFINFLHYKYIISVVKVLTNLYALVR